MLSLLFAICMIWFIGKFFIFGLKYRTKGNEQNRINYIVKIPEDIQKIKRKNM